MELHQSHPEPGGEKVSPGMISLSYKEVPFTVKSVLPSHNVLEDKRSQAPGAPSTTLSWKKRLTGGRSRKAKSSDSADPRCSTGNKNLMFTHATWWPSLLRYTHNMTFYECSRCRQRESFTFKTSNVICICVKFCIWFNSIVGMFFVPCTMWSTRYISFSSQVWRPAAAAAPLTFWILLPYLSSTASISSLGIPLMPAVGLSVSYKGRARFYDDAWRTWGKEDELVL